MTDMKDNVKALDEAKLKATMEIRDAYDRGEISLEDARSRIHEVTGGSLKPWELAYIEQQFKPFQEDECKTEDIQAMLDVYEGILDTSQEELDETHPISRYRQEIAAMESLLLEIEDLVQYPLIKNQWLGIYDRMLTWKTHLSRKQNQLYPVLEKKGFDRPTTTMWTLDDFIRDEIRDAAELLKSDQDEAFLAMQETLVADVRDLNQKELTVLYPTSLEMISPEEFEDMKSGDAEIGYALIDVEAKRTEAAPLEDTHADDGALASELLELLARHGKAVPTSEKLHVAEGELTLEQINLIYKHLPVDLSYVDENELVCFYSDTKHRVFPRSKNVIGRDVKNCHPRKSVHIVEEIVEKFRSGEQDEVEFWINKPELFIYIKYVAVRDSEGTFRGVLEMMQDCTHIRSLTGSRTLLTWEGETAEAEDAKPNEVAAEEHVDEAKASLGALEISADTKLKTLMDVNPHLKEQLMAYSDAFKMLGSPLARVMIPKATVAMMSERSGIELDVLIAKLNEFMHENTSA